MPNDFFKKIIGFLRAEKKVFLVLVFLAVTFLVNRELYVGKKTTSEKCFGGKCLETLADAPQLDGKKDFYYIDDLLQEQPAGFYRLTFWEKADRAEKIILKLSTYTEKESPVGELELTASADFKKQELFFFLPDGFDSLLFQKEEGEAEIFIKEVGVTKLNIDSQEELAGMRKTILSEGAEMDVVRAAQLEKDYAFSWLKEKKMILGQVFLASDELITAVALDITVNRNIDPGSRQYVLNLRKVNYDGSSVSFSGPVISSLEFSVKGIEKYRQADGTFLFPLFGKLKVGEYYSISIDNSRVSVGEQNYLELRGTKKGKGYTDGEAIVRKFNALYPLDGDLFFRIYGADFWEESGVRILSGAKIEDLGKGLGKYSYESKGKFSDLLDLDSVSPGTNFSESAKVIFAPTKDDANFIYAVNTIYPIKKAHFFAQQLKANWKKVKVSYSFDQKDWIDLTYAEKMEAEGNFDQANDSSQESDDEEKDDSSGSSDGQAVSAGEDKIAQIFDADVVPTKEVRTIYFRVTYDESDENPARFFALKDLKITAELKMNLSPESDRLK